MNNDTPKVIKIPLSKRSKKHAGMYEATVSVEDKELAELNWNILITKHQEYATYCYYEGEKRKIRYLHREIMERMLERKLVKGEMVDHINRDGLDNRRENLRLATKQQNNANAKIHSHNTTGYKGVCKTNKRYRAYIHLDNKRIHLGYFDTPEEAHQAYCEAADKYFGDFANPSGK